MKHVISASAPILAAQLAMAHPISSFEISPVLTNGSGTYMISGNLANVRKYTRLVEGSPYFSDEFLPATIYLRSGTFIAGIQVKINLENMEVFYRDKSGTEMVIIQPLSKLVIYPSANDSLLFRYFANEPGAAIEQPSGWLLQLYGTQGIELYKHFDKRAEESTVYGQASKELRILTYYQYWAWYAKVYTKMKTLDEITDVKPDKKETLANAFKSKKLSTRQDADWVEVCSILEGF